MTLPVVAVAAIHQWQDAEGRTQFSDRPASQVGSVQIQANPVPASPAADPASSPGSADKPATGEAAGRPADARDLKPRQSFSVLMYATRACGYCQRARVFMRQRGIRWHEVDIESSEQALQDFKRRGGSGVPLIYVDGQAIAGFDEQQLKSIFARYGY